MKIYLALILFFTFAQAVFPQAGELSIVRLKYSGGGDWYNDPSADVNLLKFMKENFKMNVSEKYQFVDISSDDIFFYPILFLTGHGNIVFSSSEVERLRKYLAYGGFLYIDDDYGLNNSIRREMKKVFPENDFVELPFSHPIYNIHYKFPYGPPKTHKHDEKPPQGFGIYLDDRLAVYYTYESNPSDGWADAKIHNNPEDKRTEAFQFGANIILFALTK